MGSCIGGFKIGDKGKEIGEGFTDACFSSDERGGTGEKGRDGALLDGSRCSERERG